MGISMAGNATAMRRPRFQENGLNSCLVKLEVGRLVRSDGAAAAASVVAANNAAGLAKRRSEKFTRSKLDPFAGGVNHSAGLEVFADAVQIRRFIGRAARIPTAAVPHTLPRRHILFLSASCGTPDTSSPAPPPRPPRGCGNAHSCLPEMDSFRAGNSELHLRPSASGVLPVGRTVRQPYFGSSPDRAASSG